MIGKTLLHYEITASIGKGGMGEVYSARDTKLGRDVALKILPAELSGDPEREARFQMEARALATLQHPNVASVYGFEECEGMRFLVLELIQGRELTERMEEGPIPVEEARVLARQIAAGLEAAHEAGIVHRDLKPANIMETEDGQVKILDFGLAQAWFGDSGLKMDSGTMPTMTAALTQIGTVLGTAAYMSPEQARGHSVDRRTDIWAFGVILFEMLTGQKLFHGETVSDTLAAVLRAEPDWSLLPVDEAPQFCRLIERCLERDPRQRLRDIGEARIFLQDGTGSDSHLSFSMLGQAAPAVEAPARRPSAVLLVVAVLAGLLGGGLLGWKVLGRPEPAPVLHATLLPPAGTEYDLKGTAPGPATLSPDGTMVTFTARDKDGVTLLYLRHLDQADAVSLSGTESANYPFWSPDSRSIGFFDETGGKMKKVAVGGGPPVTICPSENGKGGSWNTDGMIIFAPSYDTGIFVVPAIGGAPQQVTRIAEGYDSNRHPRFLPDGRRFIYIGRTMDSDRGNDVFLASLDTTVAPRVIAQTQGNADYNLGHLLTVREGVLMATPFSPDQERAIAGGTPLVEDILYIPGAAVAVFGVSDEGMIVYQTGATSGERRQLAWMDLTTGSEVAVGEPGNMSFPRVSPDGKLAMLEIQGASKEGTDCWLVDLETGLRNRFTFSAGDEGRVVWDPDGSMVYYTSHPDSLYRIMAQPIEGLGGIAELAALKEPTAPTGISPDGRYLLLDHAASASKFEIWRLDLEDNAAVPEKFVGPEDAAVGGASYSPDGRWVAYHATSAAGWDIFVMPAEGGARKWQVTPDGAVYPQWSPDGTFLVVQRFTGDLEAYPVDGSGRTFRIGALEALGRVAPPDANGRRYDLDPAGGRLLHCGSDPAFRTEVSFVNLVTDWRRGLAQ